MKYKDLLADAFAHKSNQDTTITIGLIAGLAVGAALAVLFTPISGRDLRERLLAKNEVTENEQDNEPQPSARSTPKKPKSDIKEIIHQAHMS